VSPAVRVWLRVHGLPAVLLPDYFLLAAVAAVLTSLIALRLADRDGASRVHAARALAFAYVAALLGGYVFEAVRAVPAAVIAGSWRPILHAGRAAYGGLLGASLAATLYLAAVREPIVPFFDRVAIGCGLTFALVRTGCFLAGCDYGAPTAAPWGVRFPPGSVAAVDHFRRGFVPHGAASLPVHPTQLYEAALGLLAAALASVVIRKRDARDGLAFATFLTTYAIGRFLIEFLRADDDRGHALELSTAQWVSLAIVSGLVFAALRGAVRARPSAADRPRSWRWARR
jgi:prolipoprotein diacylglyceryltransferase